MKNVFAALRSKWVKFQEFMKNRGERCVLYRIYEDQEKGAIVRYRDKKFLKSELPPCALPVTGERNAYGIVCLDAPPRAPHGQDAVILYIWSEDYSFEKSFEHLSDDSTPMDWKKILTVIGIAIAGAYVMYVSGVVG